MRGQRRRCLRSVGRRMSGPGDRASKQFSSQPPTRYGPAEGRSASEQRERADARLSGSNSSARSEMLLRRGLVTRGLTVHQAQQRHGAVPFVFVLQLGRRTVFWLCPDARDTARMLRPSKKVHHLQKTSARFWQRPQDGLEGRTPSQLWSLPLFSQISILVQSI